MSQPDRLLLTGDDFRQAASSKLKKLAKDYYESGSDDQLTLRRNERAFEKLLIRPRCLRDVSNVDTSTEWFGRKQRFPIGIAPTAFHRMANEDGELNTVKGASAAGSVMIVSSWATTAIEEVAEQARRVGAELWFQIEALADVVRASRGGVPVFMDGGVRNGRDIFKAIALGAQGVFVGRPVLWGLSVKGSEGVYQVMSILQQEFVHAMKLAGFRSIKEIQECPDVVVREEFFSRL